MPELPEAESIRRRIADGALNRTIERVLLGNDTKYVDLPGPDDRDRLVGRQFTRTHRHGKYIFAGSADGPWMLVHLGMAGSVRVFDEDEGRHDYARFLIEFEGSRRLAFRDPRKFGWVKVIDDPEDEVASRGLGPDALSIDAETFAERIGGSRGAVKSALLDQKKLAGVGNLWADEALYRTGLASDTPGETIGDADLSRLFNAVRDILRAVCEVNADYAALPDDWLIHHRESDDTCPRCGGTIAKKTVAGRTAYYCTNHQGDYA